jgi:hypothetical protein
VEKEKSGLPMESYEYLSFPPFQLPLNSGFFSCLFYRLGNQGTESLRNFPGIIARKQGYHDADAALSHGIFLGGSFQGRKRTGTPEPLHDIPAKGQA